jgi:YbgC/YbaW family acyl-CoA thioester hydrolase
MPYQHKVRRRVEFSETDMAGIMHFSNFFRFMETAEHAFMRSLGYSVVLRKFDPPLSLPRVQAHCDYLAPLRFEDEVEVHLLVARKTARTLSYQFRFYRRNGKSPVETARGYVTVVCAVRQPDGRFTAVPLPKEIARKISVAPAAHMAPMRKVEKP